MCLFYITNALLDEAVPGFVSGFILLVYASCIYEIGYKGHYCYREKAIFYIFFILPLIVAIFLTIAEYI